MRPFSTPCRADSPAERRALRPGVLVLLAALISGCGPGPDNWPEGRPRIDALDFIRQSPGNSLNLEFEIAFFDSDADLAPGRLFLSIDGRASTSQSLAALFEAQSLPVAPDATSGEFAVDVQLSGTLELGERVTLGFLLEDARAQRSNEPTVTLEALSN